jgi:hypothetical protein
MVVQATVPTDTQRRGHDAGHDWARNRAVAVELDCLHDFVHRHGLDLSEHHRGEANDPYRAADYLAFWILGLQEDEFNYFTSLEFWQNAVGCTSLDDLRHNEYLQGFINGALEVERVVTDYGVNELER